MTRAPGKKTKDQASPSSESSANSDRPIAAVTGGSGFIGRALVSRLEEAGYRVRVLTSKPVAPRAADAAPAGVATGPELFQADLLQPDAARLAEFLDGVSVLFHLAGAVSREPDATRRLMALHVEGTRHLFEAARTAGTERIVLMSTSGTVGVSAKPTPATDASDYAIDPALRWPYYESKIYQEKLAIAWSREHGKTLAVLRPSLALGPGDHDLSSTGDVLNFLERKIPGIPGGGLSFVDARDIADAAVAAAQLDADILKTDGAPYRTYLLGAANMSFREYLALLQKLSGVSAPTIEVPPKLSVLGAKAWSKFAGEAGRRLMDLDPASAEMANYYWYVDSSRAERELGFQPRPADATLRETIDWLRNRNR
ncbi:MAG: NAD-dependent epimerase/dehydratase family protein [bacterium]|nr:NAD-dependent epimerase/dehydratase family protein [bacterium]